MSDVLTFSDFAAASEWINSTAQERVPGGSYVDNIAAGKVRIYAEDGTPLLWVGLNAEGGNGDREWSRLCVTSLADFAAGIHAKPSKGGPAVPPFGVFVCAYAAGSLKANTPPTFSRVAFATFPGSTYLVVRTGEDSWIVDGKPCASKDDAVAACSDADEACGYEWDPSIYGECGDGLDCLTVGMPTIVRPPVEEDD